MKEALAARRAWYDGFTSGHDHVNALAAPWPGLSWVRRDLFAPGKSQGRYGDQEVRMPSLDHREGHDRGFTDKALALRKRTGLTQSNLVNPLALSVRSVNAWEGRVSSQ